MLAALIRFREHRCLAKEFCRKGVVWGANRRTREGPGCHSLGSAGRVRANLCASWFVTYVDTIRGHKFVVCACVIQREALSPGHSLGHAMPYDAFSMI